MRRMCHLVLKNPLIRGLLYLWRLALCCWDAADAPAACDVPLLLLMLGMLDARFRLGFCRSSTLLVVMFVLRTVFW